MFIKFDLVSGLLLSAALLGADTLYLKDGRTLEGRFVSGNSQEIRFQPDGSRIQRHRVANVDRLAFGDELNTTSSSSYSQSGAQSSRTYTGTRARSAESVAIPAGTVVTVRTIDRIESDDSNIGDSIRASIAEPVVVDGRTVVPEGADVTLRVARVKDSGTISGREEIAIVMSEVAMNGRMVPVESQIAEVRGDSRTAQSAKVIGGGAALGAVIGAITGGGKGAAIGAATGAGAGVAVQAIRGQEIEIPAESLLNFTIAEPVR